MNSSAQLPSLVTNAHQRGCGTRRRDHSEELCVLAAEASKRSHQGWDLAVPSPSQLLSQKTHGVQLEGISFCIEMSMFSQYGEPMWCFLFTHPLLSFCPLTSHWNLPLGTPLKMDSKGLPSLCSGPIRRPQSGHISDSSRQVISTCPFFPVQYLLPLPFH